MARVIGEQGGVIMKRRIVDSNLPIGKLTRVKDVLPPPDKLVIPEQTVKVTLFLSKSSVKFFKNKAAQYQTKYQRMIRELVDRYTENYSR